MSRLQFTRLWRPFALVAAGIIVGAGLVAPAAAREGAVVAPAAIQTRTSSCQGLNFHPIYSNTQVNWNHNRLFRSGTSGDGFVLCDPHLPHQAVVTRVRFTILDARDDAEVVYCGLIRSSLTASLAAANPQTMALVAGTGIVATPGTVRRSDTSIAHATIDNTQWGYWLQCQLTGDNDLTGIFGADVTYRISSANG